MSDLDAIEHEIRRAQQIPSAECIEKPWRLAADLAAELRSVREELAAARALCKELQYECDNFAPPDSSFETGYPEISPEFWTRVRNIHDRLFAAVTPKETEQ